jgi:hypothetical protein
VLFSQDRVASAVNRWFEPCWQSVRPVPVVRIDFGDGRVLTRTLHGNILTSVCTPDGLMVDALPGIYTEKAYLDRLNKLRLLAHLARAQPAAGRDAWVRAYHRREAQALREPDRAKVAAALAPAAYITKSVIERPVELAVRTGRGNASSYTSTATVPPTPAKEAPPTTLRAGEDVSRWTSLEEDTRLNEGTRRRQIHELLAAAGLVRPDEVTRPIYRDVLHADLDDPYLGLGEALFANYPFAKEDALR